MFYRTVRPTFHLLLFLIYLCYCESAKEKHAVSGSSKLIKKTVPPKTEIFCYFTSWSRYREGKASFTADDVDSNLCTSVIFSFLGLNTNRKLTEVEIVLPDMDDEENVQVLRQKTRESNSKLLAALGGAHIASVTFSKLLRKKSVRQELAVRIKDFLEEYDFDGFVLDWEFPTEGTTPKDRRRFTRFVQALRKVFSTEFQLVIAVSPGRHIINPAYEVKALNKAVDFIHVMTYNFHGPWENKTGINAPIRSQNRYDSLTVDWAMRFWRYKGASKSKLILGIPFYSRTFRLCDSKHHNLSSPTCGPGEKGAFTQDAGFLSYCEAKKLSKSWNEVKLKKEGASYRYKDNQWISFEGIHSVRNKVLYAKKKRLAGIMIWALDFDDFNASCGKTKYPLLKEINKVLS